MYFGALYLSLRTAVWGAGSEEQFLAPKPRWAAQGAVSDAGGSLVHKSLDHLPGAATAQAHRKRGPRDWPAGSAGASPAASISSPDWQIQVPLPDPHLSARGSNPQLIRNTPDPGVQGLLTTSHTPKAGRIQNEKSFCRCKEELINQCFESCRKMF